MDECRRDVVRSNTVRGRSTKITLGNLINRLTTDYKLLEAHPDSALLPKRIARHKDDISNALLKLYEQNPDGPISIHSIVEIEGDDNNGLNS